MESITIWDKNQVKRTFFSKEIRSSVKDTLSLFRFIEDSLQPEEINTVSCDAKKISFLTKIINKKIKVEIIDADRENFLEINAYNPRKNHFGGVHEWSNKQIFGLKYSLWIVLLIVAISIIPLVIMFSIQENLSQESQTALRIGGIVLISIGGVVFILYLVFTRLSLGRQVQLYDSVTDFAQKIVTIIENYKEDSKGKKVCWSCYKEIKKETPKCPYCGIDL